MTADPAVTPSSLADLMARLRDAKFSAGKSYRDKNASFNKASLADIAVPHPLPIEPELESQEVGETFAEEQGEDPWSGIEGNLEDPANGHETVLFSQGPEEASVFEPSAMELTTSALPPSITPMDEETINRIKEEAYSEGFAAGKATAESATEGQLSANISRLEELLMSLSRDDVVDLAALGEGLDASVRELAGDVIGYVIETTPEPFVKKLEGLLAEVAHLLGHRTFILNPDDLAFLSEYQLPEKLSDVRFEADPNLPRGYARVRVGGAEIGDRLTGST